MNWFIATTLSWLLLPLALYQGLAVRKRTPRLTPPQGTHKGQIGSGTAKTRLLILGDSSAAGVGVEKIEDTLGPRLARCLHEALGKPVYWRNAGANSAIAEQVRDFVIPNIDERDFTHIIIAIGTNDTKNYIGRLRFKKGFGGLLYAAHARWPDAKIFWTPVLDMHMLPALPPILSSIINLRSQMINEMASQLCRERHAIAADPLPIEGTDGFAVDGFHPNAQGYQIWAQHLARTIMDAEAGPASSQKSQ